MKVLFLNIPYQFPISRASRWPEKTKSGTLYYPYWLAYAAGIVMERGHEVSLIDCITRHMDTQQTVEAARAFAPDLLVAEVTTPTCYADYEVLTALREALPETASTGRITLC